MNIFVLSNDPVIAARSLCDKHVVKMGLEASALLSAAHHICGSNADLAKICKLSWQYHPCSKWVRKSLSNYKWLLTHTEEIFLEYSRRYSKVHSYVQRGIVNELQKLPRIEDIGFTEPYLAMPEDVRSSDYVQAYRDYYNLHKVGKIQVKYTKREKPEWLKSIIK